MNPGPTRQMQGGSHHGESPQSLDRLHTGQEDCKVPEEQLYGKQVP